MNIRTRSSLLNAGVIGLTLLVLRFRSHQIPDAELPQVVEEEHPLLRRSSRVCRGD